MTNLLIHAPGKSNAHFGTFFGGYPTVPSAAEFSWPVCRSCKGNMQYLGRIAIPSSDPSASRHALLFMCQNDPGCCDEWESDGGGNSVLIVAGALAESVVVPTGGVTLREAEYGTSVVSSPLDNYETARQAWAESTGNSPREVLGQLRGSPVWIQSDETPSCDACGNAMHFLAQLEQGPDCRTEMNFGGGCAYVFECSCVDSFGKFVWQCG